MAKARNTVLVVEDEEHIRTVVEYNLRRQGFDVYTAENGLGGLDLARKVRPDVILLDWMMPEMDGLEVLAELKRDRATSKILVLMLTARGMAGDMERALRLGADDYITKPFDPASLGGIIVEKLEKQARQAPAASSAGAVADDEDGLVERTTAKNQP
ncbi:MAG TPA: response regulator [Sedimentisphaerales bacterium]|nr:response regulator [Sedimentisphaerales bacterium]